MEIYIDLGTANTLIYIRGKGFVLNQPSAVTVSQKTRDTRIIASGTQAKLMLGKTPSHLYVQKPLKKGVISDFNNTEKMLHMFLKKVREQNFWFRPKILISLPCKVTEFERRAVEEVGLAMGAKNVKLIDEPLAAAIGAGLPVFQPKANMIVDIGGGTTEIAIISMGGVVYANAVRTGGEEMDQRITEYLSLHHKFAVGEQTAEKIKMRLGYAVLPAVEEKLEIKGLDLVTGLPRRKEVTSTEIFYAIDETVKSIIKSIKVALEQTPPELSADLLDSGIFLAGGGAMLLGLKQRVEEEIGLKTCVVENPLFSVASGGARVLEDSQILEMIAG